MTPFKYRTMAEIAAEALREAILTATYPPGTRLVPARLEKDLRLGRTAIREALKELTCAGLLISIPNKGAIVADPPEMEEIEQIFEIRYLLEGKAAHLATERMAPDVIKRLEGMHERMCSNSLASYEYSALNREFHLAIYQISGWKFLYQLIVQLIEKVHFFRTYYPVRSQDFDAYNRDHEEILRYLKKRHASRVSEVVVRNAKRGFEGLKEVYGLRKESLGSPGRSEQQR